MYIQKKIGEKKNLLRVRKSGAEIVNFVTEFFFSFFLCALYESYNNSKAYTATIKRSRKNGCQKGKKRREKKLYKKKIGDDFWVWGCECVGDYGEENVTICYHFLHLVSITASVASHRENFCPQKSPSKRFSSMRRAEMEERERKRVESLMWMGLNSIGDGKRQENLQRISHAFEGVTLLNVYFPQFIILHRQFLQNPKLKGVKLYTTKSIRTNVTKLDPLDL